MIWWMAAGAAFVLVAGCAEMEHGAIDLSLLDISRPLRLAQVSAAIESSTEPAIPSFRAGIDATDGIVQIAQAPPSTAAQEEEPFDPFAELEEGSEQEYDPWEPLNSRVFEFNRQVDRLALKPVAQAYNAVVPNFVQVSVSNFIFNLRFPQRFLNNVFQRKVKGAGLELGRFLVNSTFGVGGFLDVAKDMDLNTPEEDTGQTLGFYGVKPGPYLVLPFLPPFTVRDLIGYAGDIALNPVNWLVAPIFKIGSIPSAIPQKNDFTITAVQLGARAYEILNDRSLNLEKFQGVEEATLDLYTAVRNAYLQKRARLIRE